MSQELQSNLIIISLALFLVSILGYIVYQVVKNEKKAKPFRDSLKIGDKCHCSTSENGVSGEVIDLNPTEGSEFIKISILVRKSRIYPNV